MNITPQFDARSAPTPRRPKRLAGLAWAMFSCRGARGGGNEDAVLAQPPRFFGVSDGVGGGSHGEVASQVVLRHCAEARDLRPQALIEHVQAADGAVAAALALLSDRVGAATLVALWLRGCSARLLHVGDARALLLRRSWRGRWRLVWCTEDQTYAALGKEPPAGGDPGDPCRMVGAGTVGEPGLKVFRLRENDVVLLCSDGLHRGIGEEALTGMVSGDLRAGLTLDDVARHLAGRAAHNGSRDDISVLLLRRVASRTRPWLLAILLAALTAWAALQGVWH